MLLGIDIGGTKIKLSLISKKSNIIKSVKVDTKFNHSKEEFFTNLVNLINLFDLKKISSIGLGIPSAVENGYSWYSPNVTALNEINFKKELESRVKKKVYVTNDANCFAYGELVQNPELKKKSFVALTLGTGLGSGIVINGRLLNGLMGCGGEVGFIYDKGMKIKNYCSSRFFKAKGVSPKEAELKARNGIKKYIKMYEEFGREVGYVLSIYANTLAPDVLIIGGGISRSKDLFEKEMIKSFKKEAHQILANKTTIEFSKNKHSSVIGAANLYRLKYI
ncbi:ROK family protein [Candidatus Woesearchaeota archaeon]|nr:ROK family protein [Candidatus Woesearchaeota archaeon]